MEAFKKAFCSLPGSRELQLAIYEKATGNRLEAGACVLFLLGGVSLPGIL